MKLDFNYLTIYKFNWAVHFVGKHYRELQRTQKI